MDRSARRDEMFSTERVLIDFFNNSNVGFAIVDDQLRYQALNLPLAEMNGIAIKFHLGKTLREVLGEVADMQCNEVSFGMTRDHSVSRLNQLGIRGKIVVMKRPIGMIAELLVSLVEPIRGREKGNWIGDMDCDGHLQMAADLPHGIKPGIVDLHELSGGDVVPQIEPEGLEDFQTAGPVTMSLFDRFCLNLWIAGFEKARVTGFSERVEPVRMSFVVPSDGFDEAGIKSAGQVYHGTDIFPVHNGDQFSRIAQVSALCREWNAMNLMSGNGNVRMEINHRVP